MSSSATAEGARRALSQFAAGVQLLKILDKRPAHEADVVENLVCTAARLVEEAAAGAAAGGGAPGAADAAVAVVKDVELAPTTAKCVIPDLSFNTPWGKYSLMWFDHMLVLKSAKAEIRVPVTAIKQIAILDRFPKDSKERVVVFIVLDKACGVMSGKQRLESLVLQMLADTQMRVQVLGDEEAQEGPAPVVLCSILGRATSNDGVFLSPDDDVYQNATGAPCLAATTKANAGWLYPLEGALCFVERPPLFFSHQDIASYELQRAEGSSSSFDLVLRLTGPKAPKVEFNIARGELGRLQTYLERSKLPVFGSAQAAARQARGNGAALGDGAGGGSKSHAKDIAEEEGCVGNDGGDDHDADEDSDDEEDEDFDPEASDHSTGWRPAEGTEGGASSSAAAKVGAQAEEGSDEDSDEDSDADSDADSGDDDMGSEDLVSEEDVPKSALKARMVKEKEARGTKRKERG